MMLFGSAGRRFVLFLILIIGVLLDFAFAFAESASAPTVSLASGALIGTTTRVSCATDTVNKFLGIPFADSPPERFGAPQPPAPWKTPRDATQFSAACIQQYNYPESARKLQIALFNNPADGPPPHESEDCLYLNVYAPSTPPPSGGRAVMFWIFGGGFSFGTAMQSLYDGSSFAACQDVVVVAANYRTNAFGVPGAPQLPLAQRNPGLLDQHKALEWVQQNIGHFGGDPNKVTVFGESAGASSVDSLINAMPDNPPFRAAIMESGQATYGPLRANTGLPLAWNDLVAGLNCSHMKNGPASREAMACVRNASTADIKSVAEHQQLAFEPVIDNVTRVSDPQAARAVGRYATVPVMLGTNANEGTAFQFGQTNLTQFLEKTFPDLPRLWFALRAAYPVFPPQTEASVIAQIYGDYLFTCPARIYASAAKAAGIPAWRYYFDAVFENTNPIRVPALGVFHSSEIPLVFGTFVSTNATAREAQLSSYMQTAWANFAKNPHEGPGWPSIGARGQAKTQALGADGSAGGATFDAMGTDSRCGVFDMVYAVENT